MKSNIHIILSICFCILYFLSHSQNNSCPGNIFQNGDLEIGMPTNGDNDINRAVGFEPIWNAFGSLADYYPPGYMVSNVYPAPSPISGNWAGFWVKSLKDTINANNREGLFNTLSQTILPNTGTYSFSFDLACLAGSGNPQLGIYGINNPSGNPSDTIPINSHTPPNTSFFNINNTMLLGSVVVPSNCDGIMTQQTITFNSSDIDFPASGITHILMTHNDLIIPGSIKYIAVDNFCMMISEPAQDTSCAMITTTDIICEPNDMFTFEFEFTYNGTPTVDGFIIYDGMGNQITSEGGLTLETGDTYSTSFTTLEADFPECISIQFLGATTCCHFDYCLPEFRCQPCERSEVEYSEIPEEECCYSIDIENAFFDNNISFFTTTVITPGVVFSNPVANQGWTVTGSGNELTWNGPAATIPFGDYLDVMNFCFDNVVNINQTIQEVVVDWYSIEEGEIILECSDTLEFNCTACLVVSDEDVECLSNGTYEWGFSVSNIAADPMFDATNIIITALIDSVCVNGFEGPASISLNPPLSTNGIADITAEITDCGAGLNVGDEIPFRLVLAQGDVCCHVDTLWLTLPDCDTLGVDCTDLEDRVAQGYTVTSNNTGGLTIVPNALLDSDEVIWTGNSLGIANTTGNDAIVITAPTQEYEICMIVTDTITNCRDTFCEDLDSMIICNEDFIIAMDDVNCAFLLDNPNWCSGDDNVFFHNYENTTTADMSEYSCDDTTITPENNTWFKLPAGLYTEIEFVINPPQNTSQNPNNFNNYYVVFWEFNDDGDGIVEDGELFQLVDTSVPNEPWFSGCKFTTQNVSAAFAANNLDATKDYFISVDRPSPGNENQIYELCISNEISLDFAEGKFDLMPDYSNGQWCSNQVFTTLGMHKRDTVANYICGYNTNNTTIYNNPPLRDIWFELQVPASGDLQIDIQAQAPSTHVRNQIFALWEWVDADSDSHVDLLELEQLVGGTSTLGATGGACTYVNNSDGSITLAVQNLSANASSYFLSVGKHYGLPDATFTICLSDQITSLTGGNLSPLRLAVYPNPTNENVNLEFNLEEDTRVALRIYDVNGNLIETVIADEKLNSGEYQYKLDVSDLANGIYFYEYISNGIIQSDRIIIMK